MEDLIFALLWVVAGILGSYVLFWLLSFAISLLPRSISKRVTWFAFLSPAMLLVIVIMILPLFQTINWSFRDDRGEEWVGVQNYIDLFTDEGFREILVNNLLWLIVVPAFTVLFGLAAAALSNQVGPTREKIFKSLIFMPMAVSFIAAGTIWSYFYAYVPPGRPELGLLNAVVKSLGFETQPWLTIDRFHLNSFLLMVIIIWLQSGFAMVFLSAAIKGVPQDTIEAANIDGASSLQVFFRVILPQIGGMVAAIYITILIFVMKVFDIVLAMTNGGFGTSVLAFEWYKQFFENTNVGPASAVVMVLLIFIIPLMYLQITMAKRQEELR